MIARDRISRLAFNAMSPALQTAAVVISFLSWSIEGTFAQTAPTITVQPASQSVPAGTSVILSVVAGGTGPFAYQWQFNGTNISKNIITTVAGGGIPSGFSGDGDYAITNATLGTPFDAVLDAAGNMYIADSLNNRIRKVNQTGVISTYAGGGTNGLRDGGPASSANLSYPSADSLGGNGNLYIADNGNHRIRRVDTNGIITTVAGGGTNGLGGPATNALVKTPLSVTADSMGNLYISDQNYEAVLKVGTNGIITLFAGGGTNGLGDGGPATNASLNSPSHLAFDSAGDLYIADSNNGRVRKVDTNGIITTYAGGGTNGLQLGGAATNSAINYPIGVCLDAVGNLYIASFDERILKVDTNGIITVTAGGGSSGVGDGSAPTNAMIVEPSGVSFDSLGNLYIADRGNNRIRKLLLHGGDAFLSFGSIGNTNAGNYQVIVSNAYGSVTSAVATVTIEAPPQIISQPASQTVATGTSSLLSVTVAGSGPFEYSWYFEGTNLVQSGPGSSVTLSNVSMANAGGYMVVASNSYGGTTSQVATLTIVPAAFVVSQPQSQTVPAGGNVTFSVTAGGAGPFSYQWRLNGTNIPRTLVTVAGNGTNGFSGDGGPATNAEMSNPYAATFDALGDILISDYNNNRVRKVTTSGIIFTVAGNGQYSSTVNGSSATNTGVPHPEFATVDTAGNLYIVQGTGYVAKVGTNGSISVVAGKNVGLFFSGDGGPATNAGFDVPCSMAFDAAGNYYIADTSNNRIRKVSTNGIVTTVIGLGGKGFAGDGGLGLAAFLNAPNGIYVDNVGNLFISDSGNNRVREIDTNGIIRTIAGNGVYSDTGDGGPATNASIFNPEGVAVDSVGNILIADNYYIRQIDRNGIITTLTRGAPTSVAVDPNGNILISQYLGPIVQELLSQGPVLQLGNVSPTNAGDYSVVITSPYNTVTSSVATLTVTVPNTPPQIIINDSSFGFVSNQFGFNVSGSFGQTIVIDASTDLMIWTPLFTNVVGSGPFYFFDPTSTNYSERYYRARLQ